MKKKITIGIIILLVILILSFVIPVRIEHGTRAPTGPKAYLIGPRLVSEYYNIYGMKIYEK